MWTVKNTVVSFGATLCIVISSILTADIKCLWYNTTEIAQCRSSD